jgi:hypothetical protein
VTLKTRYGTVRYKWIYMDRQRTVVEDTYTYDGIQEGRCKTTVPRLLSDHASTMVLCLVSSTRTPAWCTGMTISTICVCAAAMTPQTTDTALVPVCGLALVQTYNSTSPLPSGKDYALWL